MSGRFTPTSQRFWAIMPNARRASPSAESPRHSLRGERRALRDALWKGRSCSRKSEPSSAFRTEPTRCNSQNIPDASSSRRPVQKAASLSARHDIFSVSILGIPPHIVQKIRNSTAPPLNPVHPVHPVRKIESKHQYNHNEAASGNCSDSLLAFRFFDAQ